MTTIRNECDLCQMPGEEGGLHFIPSGMSLCTSCFNWFDISIDKVVKAVGMVMKIYNKDTPQELGEIL